MPKTLVLYRVIGDEEDLKPKFVTLEGDYRHLNDVYVGLTDNADKEEELQNLINSNTPFKSEPTRDWDYFIHCGFIL